MGHRLMALQLLWKLSTPSQVRCRCHCQTCSLCADSSRIDLRAVAPGDVPGTCSCNNERWCDPYMAIDLSSIRDRPYTLPVSRTPPDAPPPPSLHRMGCLGSHLVSCP